MSAPVILDASAVLAWLNGEPGAEAIDALLQAGAPCLVSGANHAEIIAKALDRGVAADAVRDIVTSRLHGHRHLRRAQHVKNHEQTCLYVYLSAGASVHLDCRMRRQAIEAGDTGWKSYGIPPDISGQID